MGYKMDKKDLIGNDTNIFSFNIDTETTSYIEIPLDHDDEYETLKDKIYKSNLDLEEKANLINKLSIIKKEQSQKERKKLISEIENYIKGEE